MKRYAAVILMLVLFAGMLSGCGKASVNDAGEASKAGTYPEEGVQILLSDEPRLAE